MSLNFDNNDADYKEGLRLFYLQQYDRAVPILTADAEAGSIKSRHFLAMMYENGNGVAQDLSKAAYWYGLTAQQGDPEAQLTYAMLCALGKGMEPDIAAACHWATVSLHQGNSRAVQTLQIIRSQAGDAARAAGAAFREAQEQGDLEEAARQLQIAAECGDPNAQYAFYQLLMTGQGVEEDHHAAVVWLKDAADQGHAEARKVMDSLMGENA